MSKVRTEQGRKVRRQGVRGLSESGGAHPQRPSRAGKEGEPRGTGELEGSSPAGDRGRAGR